MTAEMSNATPISVASMNSPRIVPDAVLQSKIDVRTCWKEVTA